MEITSTQIQHLTVLLSAELECAQQLLAVLDQEHHALTQSEAEAITRISEEKMKLLGEVQQHLANRQSFLSHLGINPGQSGVESLLKRTSGAESALALWQKLLELAQTLSEKNQVNGGIVTLGQRHVRQVLGILTGHNDTGNTYDPSGKPKDSTSRSLAKA